MNVQAFLQADPVIQIHLVCAFLALGIGSSVMLRKKGGAWHKRLGYVWVSLMMTVALSGFLIHEIRTWGMFSPIHLLSVVVPITLVLAILQARAGRIHDHRRTMRSIFIGGNVVAGIFTFLPGRLNYDIFLARAHGQSNALTYGFLIPFGAGLVVLIVSLYIAWKAQKATEQSNKVQG